VDVIFMYPDGRTGQIDAKAFPEMHAQYGAEITAYVGADGRNYAATDEGKKEATAATADRFTKYNEEVAARQAADAANVRKRGSTIEEPAPSEPVLDVKEVRASKTRDA
jgi:hypothetical protein